MSDTTDRQQALRDQNVEPTAEVLAEALGSSYEGYECLVAEVVKRGLEYVWHYYPDGSAWLARAIYNWTGPRGGKKAKTMFWLSAWEGSFQVRLYFPEKVRHEALELSLSDAAHQQIVDAKSTYWGFSLAFDIDSGEVPADLYALLDFRMTVK